MADYLVGDAVLLQPAQILNGVFRTRQYHDVRVPDFGGAGGIIHRNVALAAQNIEISEIGNMRQPHDGRACLAIARPPGKPLGYAVLVLHVYFHPGNDAQYGYAQQILDHFKPGLQNFHITPEFIYHYALYARLLVRVQQLYRAIQGCKHAAGIYVADEYHRRVGGPGHGHVYDIAFL